MAPTSSLSSLPTCCRLWIVSVLLLGGHEWSMAEPSPQSGEPASMGRRCEFDRLRPLDPLPQKLRLEAGTVEYFDETNEQLRCVGAFVLRSAIDRQGLLVPRYTDDGGLAFAEQGSGFVGIIFPGCPETYYRFRQGDIIALPPGVPFWFYNDGDRPAKLIFMFDIKNDANQIETQHKQSVLAGSSRDRRDRGMLADVGGPFPDDELLGESLRVDRRLARSLQGEDIGASNIVWAPRIRLGPRIPGVGGGYYGIGHLHPGDDHAMCGMTKNKVIMNLEDDGPAAAGRRRPPLRIARVTARNFPILNSLGLSAERGTADKNTIVSPYYNINTPDVVLLIRGSARVQVVDNDGVAVFDGEFRQGQLLIVPQLHVILRKAGSEGYEYIVLRTNANPKFSSIAGPGSYLRGLPVDVIAASYNVSTQDAIKLKNSGTTQEPI